MINSKLNKKYLSQIGKELAIGRKIFSLKNIFSNNEQKPQADSNSWSGVHVFDILTIQPWQYATILIDKNSLINIQIDILWCGAFKIIRQGEWSTLK